MLLILHCVYKLFADQSGGSIFKFTPYFFYSYSANTQIININVVIFLAPQDIQHFDFESKILYEYRSRLNKPPKITRKCAENESFIVHKKNF